MIPRKITDEIKCMTIPISRYAVFTHIGTYKGLDHFYDIAIQNIPLEYKLSDNLIIECDLNSPTDMPNSELASEL